MEMRGVGVELRLRSEEERMGQECLPALSTLGGYGKNPVGNTLGWLLEWSSVLSGMASPP